jgi:predicted nuclease of predicted toxin-antitoxin system
VKFLVENQLPVALARHLKKREFPCLHVLEVKLEEADDAEICHYAESEGSVIVSKDEDFIFHAKRPGAKIQIIWVRLGNCRTPKLLAAFDSAWDKIESCLAAGDRIIELR